MGEAESLFDRVEVGTVEAAAAGLVGPGARLVAALAEGVLSQGSDRLVVGSQLLHPAVSSALPSGWIDETAGRALAVAFGMAVALGGAERVWCLLDLESCDEGGTWEAARAAATAPVTTLTACVMVPAQENKAFRAFWDAAGWSVREIDGGNVWEILGGLDQALALRTRPITLLVMSELRVP
ncbi:MAG: hypothetical protein ACRDZO_01105 [Egibacteraceae bacterium]